MFLKHIARLEQKTSHFCTRGKKKILKHYKAWFVVEVTSAVEVTPNFKKNDDLGKENKGGFVCVMFMDLSKTLDTIHHDLLIANWGKYGFQEDAVKNYLTNKKRVRVNGNLVCPR